MNLELLHPIIERPWEYEIVGVNLQNDITNGESSIELALQKGNQIRTLRFDQPTDLEIENGFPNFVSSFCILDISSYGWENIKVQVGSFGQGPAIKFFAKSVTAVKED